MPEVRVYEECATFLQDVILSPREVDRTTKLGDEVAAAGDPRDWNDGGVATVLARRRCDLKHPGDGISLSEWGEPLDVREWLPE